MQVIAGGWTFDVHVGGPPAGAPVVLLHGFPQHSGEWDLVWPALHDAGLRSYAVDLRGYSPGARPPDPADYRIGTCAGDVLSIMDSLGLDRVHLVGHDWGAVTSWHLAARHPHRVRSLTAVSVPHPLALTRTLAGDDDQRRRSAYITLFRRPGKAEAVLLADGARRLRGLFDGVPAERVERYVTPLLVPGALTAALNWYRAIRPDDHAGLGPVRVPTTYLWSDGDVALGRTAALACADHVAVDYRFVPVPGVSHWIPDQAPAAVAAAILDRVRDAG